jgi:hypothetical protein
MLFMYSVGLLLSIFVAYFFFLFAEKPFMAKKVVVAREEQN